MNRGKYSAGMLALAITLSACGGESKPVTAPEVIATTPKSSAQIVAPVPQTASEPVAASAPVSTPTATEPASSPVAASEPVAAAPVPASTPVVGIVYYGDDQTQGDVIGPYGQLTMTAPTAPQRLQPLLQAAFNDVGVTVTNASTGGTSSSLQNELAGVDGGGQPQPARMIASGAKIAVEAHSINDFLGGETVENFQADLIQWVEDAQANGIQPVLQEPAPICNGNDPFQAQYVAVIDSVGQQLNVPVIPLYTYVQSLPDWQSHMQGCSIPDAYLNQLIVSQAKLVLEPIVGTMIAKSK